MNIGKENGIRRCVQKLYLLWKLRDLLSIINVVDIKGMVVAETYRDNFVYELSFSSLYGFIKAHKQFVFNRVIPQGSCLCEVRENACFLAKGLNKRFHLSLSTDPHNLLKKMHATWAQLHVWQASAASKESVFGVIQFQCGKMQEKCGPE